jgi:hypothetical protein
LGELLHAPACRQKPARVYHALRLSARAQNFGTARGVFSLASVTARRHCGMVFSIIA